MAFKGGVDRRGGGGGGGGGRGQESGGGEREAHAHLAIALADFLSELRSLSSSSSSSSDDSSLSKRCRTVDPRPSLPELSTMRPRGITGSRIPAAGAGASLAFGRGIGRGRFLA